MQYIREQRWDDITYDHGHDKWTHQETQTMISWNTYVAHKNQTCLGILISDHHWFCPSSAPGLWRVWHNWLEEKTMFKKKRQHWLFVMHESTPHVLCAASLLVCMQRCITILYMCIFIRHKYELHDMDNSGPKLMSFLLNAGLSQHTTSYLIQANCFIMIYNLYYRI